MTLGPPKGHSITYQIQSGTSLVHLVPNPRNTRAITKFPAPRHRSRCTLDAPGRGSRRHQTKGKLTQPSQTWDLATQLHKVFRPPIGGNPVSSSWGPLSKHIHGRCAELVVERHVNNIYNHGAYLALHDQSRTHLQHRVARGDRARYCVDLFE